MFLIIFNTNIRLLYTEVNKECVEKSKILHACYETSIAIAQYLKKMLVRFRRWLVMCSVIISNAFIFL